MAFASDSAPRSHAAGSHARHQTPDHTPDRAVHQESESIYRVGGRLAWVNGLLAAVLLVSIGAGGALTAQRLMSDDGGQQPTMRAAMSQEGTSVTGTPAATGLVTAMVPTPEECTVEPLTVDDVVAIVRDPYAYSHEKYGNAGSPVPAGPGNPAITGIVPEEEMAHIVALQRMWMACAIKGSLFQQWALETPVRVASFVRDAMPAFASEADAREFLTGLEGTTEAMLPLEDPLGVFWLISPDPAAAYYDGDVWSQSRTIYAPYTEYDRDGKPMWTITLDPRNVSTGTWVFYRASDTSPWLIQDINLENWNSW